MLQHLPPPDHSEGIGFQMAITYGRRWPAPAQVPPVVGELEAIFKALPDEELLTKLRGPRRRGPKGYDPKILWRCYVVLYYLGLPSVSDLVRTLQDNPFIASACGIDSPEGIPSQPTFSRFFARMAKRGTYGLLREVHRKLTHTLFETLPGMGKVVAMDGSDLKAWSHGNKKGKGGKVSDPDAGWCVKTNTEGNKKFVWGYKLHLLVDANHEMPIAMIVTKGNLHDSQKATALLRQARYCTNHFFPKYVLADSAYSSDHIRNHIRHNYDDCQPVIDPHPSHKRAVAKQQQRPELIPIYRMRQAVERVFSRLKSHRRMNSVRVRGLFKVQVHATLSVMTLQAQAVATQTRMLVRRVA